ncbi:Iron-containing alcohol dehydrogenase [Carpediemonas membranifera]|uniref:Iron-containing alcohol dehydrogenase n=1 Tax=Carpediemonas membranifera TaxID=201153 RepID=A0A8J6B811_9EUKA|nr:Iron-containing alcohol dehydrogenase [Carpediemonas membranifera]|eukprot:KAG9396169.1 Iron-containing alcohol dehydrogenase [Carpediemonas membranifera]
MDAAELNYCESVDINKTVVLTYGTRKQTTYFGVGALAKFADALDALNVKTVGFICSNSAYKRCGAWETIEKILAEKKIEYLMYNKIVTNPTCTSIDECRDLFLPKYNENFCVVAIGGGSPIDSAKSVAVLLEHKDKTARELYKFQFAAERRAPLIAVNITAGTGTEANKFAVASILDEEIPLKPALATPVIYPDISINDPALLCSTSPFQTACTAVDAMNHVTEASTTSIATPFSTNLGRTVCNLVAHYLPVALKEPSNLRARYWLHYAACIAGMSFDESLLHITHAMEHTLSAYVANLTHGLGLALLQPGVVAHIWADEVAAKTLCYVLKPMIGEFAGKPEEAQDVAKALRKWHESVGIKDTMATMGFTKDGIQKLVDATIACPGMDGLLALSPVKVEREDMARIYLTGFFE